MIVTNHLSNYYGQFTINTKDILLYQDGYLKSSTGAILKTLKNPIEQFLGEDLVSDNYIHISGDNLYNASTAEIFPIVVEQEIGQKDWVLFEIAIKMGNPLDITNYFPPNAKLTINGINLPLELNKKLNQINFAPLLLKTNKLEIKVNWSIAYIAIHCWQSIKTLN
jgi:hypothetical protein